MFCEILYSLKQAQKMLHHAEEVQKIVRKKHNVTFGSFKCQKSLLICNTYLKFFFPNATQKLPT